MYLDLDKRRWPEASPIRPIAEGDPLREVTLLRDVEQEIAVGLRCPGA